MKGKNERKSMFGLYPFITVFDSRKLFRVIPVPSGLPTNSTDIWDCRKLINNGRNITSLRFHRRKANILPPLNKTRTDFVTQQHQFLLIDTVIQSHSRLQTKEIPTTSKSQQTKLKKLP